MSEQVTSSAGILAPDAPELMRSSHFSEMVMHAEPVKMVAAAGMLSGAATLLLKTIAPGRRPFNRLVACD